MDKKGKILLADRNRNVRHFLRRELEADGYNVTTARDGSEVMNMINDECPDVLIMDPDLPLIDGCTVLEKIKARVPGLPLIIHTLPSDQINQPLLQDVTAVIEKGEDLDSLKKAVAAALAR